MNRALGLALSAIAALQILAAPAFDAAAKPLEISSRPIPLNFTAPEQTRIGRLVWRGGIDLDSPNERFGGFSGLVVSADGTRLTMITDEGFGLTAAILYDSAGNLTGLADGDFKRLRGEDGKGLGGKVDQDAEAMAALSDGSIIVAFERNHRLRRYPAGDAPLHGKPEVMPAPDGMLDLPGNSGVEALAALTDDSVLAIAEGGDDDPASPAFLWRDGVWADLRYQRFGNYRPSDAARLPSGDLLVLERRYTVFEGVGIRLVRVPASAIEPGAMLQPVEIAHLLPPLTIDNMEGIAVRQNDRDETIIYMVSDDNFNIVQRTLLLMFALEE